MCTSFTPPFLSTLFAQDLLVKNCVVISPFHGMYISRSSGLHLENNVFIRSNIGTLHANESANSDLHVANNIFTDCLVYKPNGTVMEVYAGTATEENNCFFLRGGDSRKAFRIGNAESPDGDGSVFTYQQAAKILNSKTPSLVADPKFAVSVASAAEDAPKLKEINERPDSIAKGRVYYSYDLLLEGEGVKMDFPDLFATDPEVIKRGVGLQPESFQDAKPQAAKAAP